MYILWSNDRFGFKASVIIYIEWMRVDEESLFV